MADNAALDTATLGQHLFTVQATDNAGNMASSTHLYTVVVAPVAGRPKGPFNVTATPGPASKQITLAWAAANPNGSPITSYTVVQGRCRQPWPPHAYPTTVGPARRSTTIGAFVAGVV